MNPEEKGDAFAELILRFRKNIVFLVGAKKITSKQWRFDKNIVLVFLFDGAVRPHESEKNDGCFSRIYGIPFGEKGSWLKPETFWSGTEEKTRGGRCLF
jgi:hypothetical protein